jgi:hypothetical protein
MFFKYEKRIRDLSAPEKIFEYFASIRGPEGVPYMLPQVCALGTHCQMDGPTDI